MVSTIIPDESSPAPFLDSRQESSQPDFWLRIWALQILANGQEKVQFPDTQTGYPPCFRRCVNPQTEAHAFPSLKSLKIFRNNPMPSRKSKLGDMVCFVYLHGLSFAALSLFWGHFFTYTRQK